MENQFISRGTMVVATNNQRTPCGRLYIKKGSILKVASDSKEYYNDVAVYRNITEDVNDEYFYIPKSNVEFATQEQIDMWNENVNYLTYTN